MLKLAFVNNARKLRATFAVAGSFLCQPAQTLHAHLVRSVRTATLLCVALTPTIGCAPSWENPAVSAAAWEQTKADCALYAAERVQPNYTYAVDTGSAFQSTNCHKNNCSTYSAYTPPSIERLDLNEPLRTQVRDACLARHGGIKKTL